MSFGSQKLLSHQTEYGMIFSKGKLFMFQRLISVSIIILRASWAFSIPILDTHAYAQDLKN